MTTVSWNNTNSGTWTNGANWSTGAAPSSADDAIITISTLQATTAYTITLPTNAYAVKSLTVSSRGATLALGGSALAAGVISLTSGTIQGGTLSSGSIAAGAGNNTSDIATLDGVNVIGTLHVGTQGVSQSLVVQDGIGVLNADGSPGTIELAGPTTGARTTLFFNGAQTWSHLAITMDAGSSDVLQGRSLGPALTLAADTTLTVNGTGAVVSTNLGGRIVIGAAGELVVNDGLLSAPSAFLSTAKIDIASGGLLEVTKAMTSTALTALAGEVEGPVGSIVANPAFNGSNSAIIPTGSAVDYSGQVTNTGAVLDLTAGGPLAHISRISSSSLVGGTLLNVGATVAMPFGQLTGVTLQGSFSMDPNLGGLLVVHDSLAVVGLDGSNGVLDLATVPTGLRIDAPSVAGATTVLDHMTIKTGLLSGTVVDDDAINAAAPLLLGASTIVAMSASGALSGLITNAGTITLADAGAAGPNVLGLAGGAYEQEPGVASTAGSFENDGTINLGAGDELGVLGAFTNKGTVNLGAGAKVGLGAGETGTYDFTGAGGLLAFSAGATDNAAIVGFRAGDTITFATAASGSTLALAGGVLTVSHAGVTVATLQLSDPGQAAYVAGDFTLGAGSNGTISITTTHATPTVATGSGTNTGTTSGSTTGTGTSGTGTSGTGTSGTGTASTGSGSTGATTTSTTPTNPGGPITVADGGSATTGSVGVTVSVSGAGTVVSNGPDTVNAGPKATTVHLDGSGANVVGGAGALTVVGGPGSNTVFNNGSGGLTYTGGSGNDTIVGAGHAMTATGGTGGGVFFGGGNAVITAGAGGVPVEIGGNGDQLYASGQAGVLFGTSGGDVLMSSAGDTGTSVFFGANGNGHMTFVTGAGNDLLALGQGTNSVTLGSGHDVIFANGGTNSVTTIQAGSGSLDLAFSGASTVLDIAAGAARSFALYLYGQGADTIHLQGYAASQAATAIANQRQVGGGTQLSLSDGSVVSLVGVQHATASLFS